MDQKILKALGDIVDMDFDGGNGTSLFYRHETISVFVNLMSEKEYDKMLKALDKTIKGKGYLVYAWNDASSFQYWKRQGEVGDSNYIQVTVDIQDLNKIDPDKLKADAQKLFNYFLKYNNVEEYYAKKAN